MLGDLSFSRHSTHDRLVHSHTEEMHNAGFFYSNLKLEQRIKRTYQTAQCIAEEIYSTFVEVEL